MDHVISLQAIDEGERLNVVYTVLAKGRSCVFSKVRQLHRYSDVLLHVQMREGCLCWDGDKDLLLNTHLLVDVSVTKRKGAFHNTKRG